METQAFKSIVKLINFESLRNNCSLLSVFFFLFVAIAIDMFETNRNNSSKQS